MLDHVTANVGDLEQAKRFYSAALAPLGYSMQMEFEGGAGSDVGCCSAGVEDGRGGLGGVRPECGA